jgi:hypothetical protein
VLVAVYLFTRLLPQAFITAADLLPAEQTVLVIGDADNESLQSWRAWLPMPTTFPTETGAVMALLHLNDERAWVTLIPAPGSNPPFTVRASTPEAKAMVTRGPHRLGDSVAYARLRPTKEGKPWAWWSATLLSDQPAIPPSITNAITAGRVTHADGRTTVTMLPRMGVTSIAGSLPSLPAADMHIGMQAPAATLGMLSKLLPDDVTLPIVGLLRERLKTLTGPDISAEFDLLPLLGGPAAFAISQTGSGTIWTLRGTDDTDLQARLSDLYGRARWSDADSVLDRRMIEGFAIDEIREGKNAGAEGTIEENGWSGWIRSDERRSICMAWHGEEYVMSNSRSGCTTTMWGEGAQGTNAMAGQLNASLLAELRALQLPGIAGSLLQGLPDSGVEWSVDIRNGAEWALCDNVICSVLSSACPPDRRVH